MLKQADNLTPPSTQSTGPSPEPSTTQKVRFAGELMFSLAANKLWPTRNQYHTIVRGPRDHGKLVLCTMPIASKILGMGGHHEEMFNHYLVTGPSGEVTSKIDLVVAALQDFELDEEGIPYMPLTIQPATKADWESLGVSQYRQIRMLDHNVTVPSSAEGDALLEPSPSDSVKINRMINATLPLIKAEVDAIDATLNAGNTAVVHCKAGVGRSALIVACFLATKYRNGLGYAAALKRLQDKRNQVNLNTIQQKMIKCYVQKYRENEPRASVFSAPIYQSSPAKLDNGSDDEHSIYSLTPSTSDHSESSQGNAAEINYSPFGVLFSDMAFVGVESPKKAEEVKEDKMLRQASPSSALSSPKSVNKLQPK